MFTCSVIMIIESARACQELNTQMCFDEMNYHPLTNWTWFKSPKHVVNFTCANTA